MVYQCSVSALWKIDTDPRFREDDALRRDNKERRGRRPPERSWDLLPAAPLFLSLMRFVIPAQAGIRRNIEC
jgi:hypothetical protein